MYGSNKFVEQYLQTADPRYGKGSVEGVSGIWRDERGQKTKARSTSDNFAGGLNLKLRHWRQ